MRSIYNETARHNGLDPLKRSDLARLPLLLVGLLAGALLFAAAGCGDGGEATTERAGENIEDQTATNPSETAQDGPLRIDDGGWRAFRASVDRIQAGEQLTLEDLSSVGDQESFRIWRGCLDTNVPGADRIGRWLEGAFWSELGRTGPMKRSGDRRAMIASYQYSYQARESVDRQVEQWSSPDHRKSFLALADLWMDPVNMPVPLTIHFLPTKPELRYCSSGLFVDTGVLVAGGNRQLEGQLVAMLYRNLQAIPMPSGPDSSGVNSVVKAFRILLNDGIAMWIEDAPRTFFRQDHYSLAKVALVPENLFLNGIKTIQFMNQHLPAMFSDPDVMSRQGPAFPLEAGAGGTLSRAGYAMVATINHHLGQERLLEVRRSVPDFLSAYQEAAQMNPEPRPIPGAPNSPLPQSMPPLDPEVVLQIQELLRKEVTP